VLAACIADTIETIGRQKLNVSYDIAVVGLSILVAFQGAYVSLSLARQVPAATGWRLRALLSGAAVTLGVGIWAMHFVGMLALQLPVVVNYDLLLTLVSALVAIIVVGVAMLLVSLRLGRRRLIVLGAIVMGVGIASMHYLGMAAMRANCITTHALPIVALSVVVGIVASALSLWLCLGTSRQPRVAFAALAMALAISGMHYTAMWAAVFEPVDADLVLHAPALSSNLLAIVVAVVAFLISGIFLLALLPSGPATGDTAEEGLGKALAAGHSPTAPAGLAERRIPVTANGATRLLSSEDILSVKANAHYTTVFDGQADHFCNLSITEVAERLDPKRFVRVHRSFIVNRDHVAAFRRHGDQGLLELDCQPPFRVPVSRGRVPQVRQLLGI
jgi:NO-binding membrane sensor protein with MHYT domain